MDTPHRMPLHDLPLDQFLTPSLSISKTPRKHKRPLSPSRTTLLNPAKRRVLDAEGFTLSNSVAIPSHSYSVPFMLSNMHTVTPTRPSRLGNGLAGNHGHSQGASSTSSSHPFSPSREVCPNTTLESCTDPQSRHYPGFDIFRDREPRRGSPVPRVTLASDGDAPTDRPDEDKENVPLTRRTKKLSSKKRFSSGLDCSDVSCTATSAQTSKVDLHPERKSFSARRALR